MDTREILSVVALVIGVITGLATIVGWIASADLLGTLRTTGMLATAGWVVLFTGPVGAAATGEQQTWPRRILGGLVALAYIAAGLLVVFLVPWPDWLFQIAGALSALVLLVAVAAELYRWHEDAERSKKTCPDCLETIKREARVCKYCHYRFE